jgi:hypothetical protein
LTIEAGVEFRRCVDRNMALESESSDGWQMLARKMEVVVPKGSGEVVDPYYSASVRMDDANTANILVRVAEISGEDSLTVTLEASSDGQHWISLQQLLSTGAVGSHYGTPTEVPFSLFRVRCHMAGTSGNVAVVSLAYYLSSQ